ncbi:hypothetical protein SAMN04488066_103159 [Halorubrum aquaticum]|uniref:Uncharacterized protein n=1 Tax=Halorubrum aquaticum TaxID=387340 RepID=A0A1I2ZV05_9EURY|nr:hypothetical protein [Halorubrum aquaticum]SFH41628.1 hypothetical protein SAMN04488066_103159 [Halorubrum aquaticum]
MSTSDRSVRSASEADEATLEDRVLLGDELPPEFRRELRSLSDIVRNPRAEPLATVVAAVVVLALGYQSYVIATTTHPLLGLVAIGVVAVAYALAKRFWTIQHRYVVRELAREGELDRLR